MSTKAEDEAQYKVIRIEELLERQSMSKDNVEALFLELNRARSAIHPFTNDVGAEQIHTAFGCVVSKDYVEYLETEKIIVSTEKVTEIRGIVDSLQAAAQKRSLKGVLDHATHVMSVLPGDPT